jgi:hypothetical protein
MKIRHLLASLMLTVASAAQALPQFQVHAEYMSTSVLDVVVTFSSDYQQIVGANGHFWDMYSGNSETIDGVWSTYTFPDPDNQYHLPSTLRGAWLHTSTGDPYDMPDLSWDFASAPHPTFPVLVVGSGAPPPDDGTPLFLWYNNSIGGPDRALRITVTAVPEPEAYAMLLAGLGLMAWVRRRAAGNPRNLTA